MVSSRAFRTRGPSSPAAMLPLIDMANHSFEPNCEVLPVKGGGVALVAKKQVGCGGVKGVVLQQPGAVQEESRARSSGPLALQHVEIDRK